MQPRTTDKRAAVWLGREERGSAAAIWLLVRLTLAIGRGCGRLFLYPICAYFLLFSRQARKASTSYLRRVLDRSPGLGDVFRHYHAFASTIHDRIYLLSGRHDYFDVEVSVPDEVREIFRRGSGCIAVGSHLGSFEIMRAQGLADQAPPVNVLMYLDNARKTSGVLHAISPDIASRIIPLGQPGSLLRAQECLARGEIVGILADRALHDDKTCACTFLGESAEFPVTPFVLAGLLEVPVILFFGLYRGGRRYEIRLEPFAARIAVDRRQRVASIRPWLERYVARLEHHCRRAPYNWFNFYDIWAQADR